MLHILSPHSLEPVRRNIGQDVCEDGGSAMHLDGDVHHIIRRDVRHVLLQLCSVIVESEGALDEHLEAVKLLLQSFSLRAWLVDTLHRRYEHLDKPFTIDLIKVLTNVFLQELGHGLNRFVDESGDRGRMKENTL